MNINTRGVILSTIFHTIILLLLLFFGFSYPDPPPEEEGILVNFGTSETGLGRVEPKGDPFQGGDIPVPEVPQISIPQATPKQPSIKEPLAQKTVQDFEESPVKIKKPTEEELKKQELERIRQEELKRQREEEERKKQQAEKIQSMGKSAFGNAGVGNTESSEGITKGTGNQGNPGGQANVPNYSDGGGLGSGISYGLGNRKVAGNLPVPLLSGCVVTSRISVRVQINVDRDGKVVGDPKVLDATFQDECIYKAVIEAASKAKFNADQNAAFRQQGWIRYIIDP